jgi:hypothetical protein
MGTPGTGYCTCTGCPPGVRKILFHVWQMETWAQQHIFEPCENDPAECCGCEGLITQEDLLCDPCRERGGISSADNRRIAAFLEAGPGKPGPVYQDIIWNGPVTWP